MSVESVVTCDLCQEKDPKNSPRYAKFYKIQLAFGPRESTNILPTDTHFFDVCGKCWGEFNTNIKRKNFIQRFLLAIQLRKIK